MCACQLILMLYLYDPGIFTVHTWEVSLDPSSEEHYCVHKSFVNTLNDLIKLQPSSQEYGIESAEFEWH